MLIKVFSLTINNPQITSFNFRINWKFINLFESPGPKMTERKAVIKNADMSEEMQQDAIDCAVQAMVPLPPLDFANYFSSICILN